LPFLFEHMNTKRCYRECHIISKHEKDFLIGPDKRIVFLFNC